jgi:hypothetical protein
MGKKKKRGKMDWLKRLSQPYDATVPISMFVPIRKALSGSALDVDPYL